MSGPNGYCHFHLYQEESDYALEGFNLGKGKGKEMETGPQQTNVVQKFLNQEMLNQQLVSDQPLNQEMFNDQLLNDQRLNQQLLNQEGLIAHPLNHLRINPNLPVSFWNLYRGPPTGPVMTEEYPNLVRRPVALSALANWRRDNGQDPPAILETDDEIRGGREGREVLGVNSASTDPVLPVYYPELPPVTEKVFCPHCLGRRYADEEELWKYADGFACPVTRDAVFTECPEVMGANRRL
jgi:hypothetical protein